jgi:cysteinyl-tRNA synthetase
VRIKDTLSGETRTLETREPEKAGIYACGPTVYGRVHVGNARPFVTFMLFGRLLRHLGYETTVVMNVTDVNDKIYDAARERGVPSADHAAEMTRLYIEDTGLLGIGRPDSEPLATETVPEIVGLIKTLVDRGHAYESSGDVYFRVRSFAGYGKLSNRDPDEMDQGEEAGTASLKESPLDFALWKARKPGEDTAWESPWGEGRPGWHIECSAMAEKVLGADFEVHGGGIDLVFPHHENEVAQSEGARGVPLARLWMHNGMVRIAEEKMSKSVGNIFGLREAIDRYGAPAVVAFLVSGHYRQPLEFSDAALEESRRRVERIRNFLRRRGDEGEDPFARQSEEAFLEALCDDFNTPRALAALFELIGEANRRTVPGAHPAVERMLPLLGLEALLDRDDGEVPQEAHELLRERDEARAAREFERADRARDRLAGLGYDVRDSPEGSQLIRRA